MMIARKKHSKVVRSAHMRKDAPRIKKEYHPKKWFFALLVVLFIGSVTYIFFCSRFVDVTQIDVKGTQRVDRNSMIANVRESISGNIAGCIKKSNFFFLQKTQIIEKIREDQRIKNVHIQKHFPNMITVTVEEHAVLPVWCIGDTGGNCFVLVDGCVAQQTDLNSALIQQNDHFIIVDRARDHVEIGQCVIAQDDLEKIAYLGKELIYVLNVGVTQPYFIDARGSREARFVTDESWDILISLTQDKEETLDMAQLFIKKTVLPVSRNDLSYVDLRFAEKIFYKIKDGVEIKEELSNDEEDEKEHDANLEKKINDAHD